MTDRFIHPLYTKEDIDDAQHYLATILASNIDILNPEGNPISNDKEAKFRQDPNLNDMLCDIVNVTLGVNTIDFANMHKVQDMYLDRYRDSLVKYATYAGYNAFTVDISISKLIPFIMSQNMKKSSFTQYRYWDPRVRWDLSYTDDVYTNMTNPSNSLLSSYVMISGMTDKNFVHKFSRFYSFDIETMCRKIDEGHPATFSIKLLPAKDYTPIMELMQTIHMIL